MMISDGTYEALECALSEDKHFIKDPIVLTSCGHTACKICVKQNYSDTVTCYKCGTETDRDLRNDNISLGIKEYFKSNLDNLLKIIEKQTEITLEQLKCMYMKLIFTN